MPLVHARDAAEGKVAAIGTVNPRPPGLKNGIIQRLKRLASRTLDWHVREQVEFNRATMTCVQATLEALADVTRSVAALTAYHQDLRKELQTTSDGLRTELRTNSEELTGIEERRSASEIHLLRTVSELQSAFHLRASLIEQNFRDSVRRQHDDFTQELDRRTTEIQKRLWNDMEKIRGEYDRLIHTELRLLRQKLATGAVPSPASAVAPAPQEYPDIDWAGFAEQFRGSEEKIRERQKCYVDRFTGASGEVLDIGCGRGEFLEAAQAAGIRGARCRSESRVRRAVPFQGAGR